MKFVRIYGVVVAATVTSAIVIFNWFRELRTYVVDEDSLVENLSAGFYLLAFVLALAVATRNRHRRWTTLGAGGVGLVGFLDEISFGERWDGIRMPTVAGVKMDGFHDTFYLAYHVMPRLLRHPAMLAAVAVATAGVAYVLARRLAPVIRAWFTDMWRHPSLTIFALAVMQIAFALVIDLQIVPVRGIFMLEEIFEMNAAIALVFCVWSLRDSLVASRSSSGSMQGVPAR